MVQIPALPHTTWVTLASQITSSSLNFATYKMGIITIIPYWVVMRKIFFFFFSILFRKTIFFFKEPAHNKCLILVMLVILHVTMDSVS